MRALRRAFLSLQAALPAVPPGTKLSKLDVLVLATSYIAHLSHALGRGPPPPTPTRPLRGHPLLHPLKVRPLPWGPAPWHRSPGSPLHDGTQSLGSPIIPCAHQQPAPQGLQCPMQQAPGVPSAHQQLFPRLAAPPPQRPHCAPCTLAAGPWGPPRPQAWGTGGSRTRGHPPSPDPSPSLAEVADALPPLRRPLGGARS